MDPGRVPMIRVCLVPLMICLAAVSGCDKKAAADPRSKDARAAAVPATVAEVIQKDVPVQLENFGTVEPFATVQIKSKIDGQLMKIHFTKGQEVKAGDLLFTIDPRPQEAALRQAEANLARNVAQLQFARDEVKRYSTLATKGSVAQQKYEQTLSTARALEAAIQADNATIENARLQLEYCFIRSPIDGVTGDTLIHQGSMIKANDLPLAIINQIRPIHVSFSVNQQHLLDIRTRMTAGELPVQVALPARPEHPVTGTLSFINNTVNTTTGTIQLQATFPNDDGRLWPGQYVWVTLTLSKQPNAVVVPSQALQTGQGGTYVYVVADDQTAQLRNVQVDRALDNETIIQNGLQPGEKVVTDGQFRLVPGAKVQIKPGLLAAEDDRK